MPGLSGSGEPGLRMDSTDWQLNDRPSTGKYDAEETAEPAVHRRDKRDRGETASPDQVKEASLNRPAEAKQRWMGIWYECDAVCPRGDGRGELTEMVGLKHPRVLLGDRQVDRDSLRGWRN